MSTLPIACGHCGLNVGAEIVFVEDVHPVSLMQSGFTVPSDRTVWLKCPSCGEGSVRSKVYPHKGATISPGALPLTNIPSLPDDVAGAWTEARKAYSVGAFTASEIVCRKILMHTAVDKLGSDPGKSFVQYVGDLQAGGYIMAGLQPIVDKIRERGNKANHALPASSADDAIATLTITQHLLVGIYELPTVSSVASATP